MSKTGETKLTQEAIASLNRLSREDRKKAIRVLKWLEESPEPDGKAKRTLPFPHRPGTCGAFHSGFMITYTSNDAVVTVFSVMKLIELG